MSDSLLLCANSESFPIEEGICIKSVYKPLNKFGRMIRWLHHKSNLLPNLKSFWLGDWKFNINHYNKIVVFDSIFDYYPLDYIKKQDSSKSIIFCYRNRVKAQITHSISDRSPNFIRSTYNAQIWSYNEEDCRLYGLRKYHQFNIIPDLESPSYIKSPVVDVCFIGRDKGRLVELMEVDKVLSEELGVSTYMHIVKSNKTKTNSHTKLYIKPSIPYNEVLDKIRESKCVLDWVNEDNKGITYRSLEALKLKKKLITNYREIEEAEYYSPKNIFIWGKDSIETLRDFLNSPMDLTVLKNIEKYSFKSFLNKIL